MSKQKQSPEKLCASPNTVIKYDFCVYVRAGSFLFETAKLNLFLGGFCFSFFSFFGKKDGREKGINTATTRYIIRSY